MSLRTDVIDGVQSVWWTHVYDPCIWFGAFGSQEIVPLPQPLLVVQDSAENKITHTDVPLQEGVTVHAAKRGARTVTFSGVITSNGQKEDVLYVADTLEMWLIDTGNAQDMSIFRYYDAVNGNYRWYENVYCRDFSVDYGSRTLHHLPYSFSILVPDGRIHERIGTYVEPP